MKSILLFLISPFFVFSQTNYSLDDIKAQQSHNNQFILTNTTGNLYCYGDALENFFSTTYNIPQNNSLTKQCNNYCWNSVYKTESVGDIPEKNVNFKYYWKDFGKDQPCGDRINTKIVVTGNDDLLVKLFVDYWNTTLDFDTVKQGEVASVRFLSDVATFSWSSKGAKIEIVSSKDR